ncbi:hypothetical protein N8946_04355 [Pseudomonadales bacterium]|nr:hypothetical protein [Pseudomonadales bacterium]
MHCTAIKGTAIKGTAIKGTAINYATTMSRIAYTCGSAGKGSQQPLRSGALIDA